MDRRTLETEPFGIDRLYQCVAAYTWNVPFKRLRDFRAYFNNNPPTGTLRVRGYYLKQVAVTAGTFINSQVISRLLYDRAPGSNSSYNSFATRPTPICVRIGKQICPGDNGWSDRLVTERVQETRAKFLHDSVINELTPTVEQTVSAGRRSARDTKCGNPM